MVVGVDAGLEEQRRQQDPQHSLGVDVVAEGSLTADLNTDAQTSQKKQ